MDLKMKGQRQTKKPTVSQLESRLKNAVLHIDKDHFTKELYFSDKGLRISVTMDSVVIATGYHQSVYRKFTAGGASRPAMYAERFLDIALENDCVVKDGSGMLKGFSYKKLFEVLKAKEDRTEYNIATYFDWFVFNAFQAAHNCGETAAEQFLTYFNYLNNIASQHIFLEEHKDGLTNLEFIKEHDKLMKDFLKNTVENQIFVPKTDEQVVQENMQAEQEQEVEQAMEGQNNDAE